MLLVLGLAAAGCAEEKKVSAAAADSATAEPARKQALGGKLAAAVKAAESAQAPTGSAADGPPEKGIFAPGGADKVIAQGASKIELLNEGSEPKTQLAYAPSEGEQKSVVSVAFRQQGRGLPVEYALSLKVDKPKGDKAKDDKKAEAPSGYRVLVTVGGVTLPPQVPKEASDQLGKMKGSEIRYRLGADGTISDVSSSLPKGADPGLEQFLRQIVDGIGVVLPPLPSKPVGAGAYWMVTDRPGGGVVDVVRYRVFRLEKLEKDHATLSIDIRQYAAKGEIDAGEGQKLALDQFESQGKGKTEWTAQGLIPTQGDAQVRMGAAGHVGSGQQAMLQAESTVKVTGASGEKDQKKK
ncbi:hypothetical protein A7982_12100 [Minicystis rosea]|nr:hypothetical protein A7982_12100 [Minicystis rosea]